MGNKSYFDTYDKSLCSGCRACEQTCKKNAITMVSDDEGFIYPKINEELCVNCNACKKVCPVAQNRVEKRIIKVYELQNKNEELLKRSSSGGVFISLAKYAIDNQGVVFGTILDKDNNAIIVSAEKEDELEKMQGSKYVFSNTLETYKEAENFLKNDKIVLYTGTPCQIAGLKCFLKKEYDNLITMDFLCHGVPSSNAFKESIAFLSKKHKGAIHNYRFRDKSLKGWGSVTSFCVDGKRHYEPGRLSTYYCGFIKGYLNRYSCYSCPFRGANRYSDITVGDFWGCDDKQINLRKGISFAALNTAKGERVFDKIKDDFWYKETAAEKVSKENSSLLRAENKEIPKIRRLIYKELSEDGYARVEKKYLITEKRLLYKAKMKLDILLKKLSIRK